LNLKWISIVKKWSKNYTSQDFRRTASVLHAGELFWE
jgi:hypothetical protein